MFTTSEAKNLKFDLSRLCQGNATVANWLIQKAVSIVLYLQCILSGLASVHRQNRQHYSIYIHYMWVSLP